MPLGSNALVSSFFRYCNTQQVCNTVYGDKTPLSVSDSRNDVGGEEEVGQGVAGALLQ